MNAGGFTVVIAYLTVVISFMVLRKNEPDMSRPYKVKHGKLVGVMAIICCLFLLVLYLPGSSASLNWPYQWGIRKLIE